jgi:hypothetical protein
MYVKILSSISNLFSLRRGCGEPLSFRIRACVRRSHHRTYIRRNEIIDGPAKLAKTHPMVTRGISGQVSAYMGLAKIMGMLIDRQVNLNEFFRGWNDEELLEYATTGNVPARCAAGTGQSAAQSVRLATQ